VTAIKLDENRMKVFLDRYAKKDENGLPIEKTPEEMWKRGAQAVAEREKDKRYWAKRFYDVLYDFQFVPGGRILAGAGTKGVTYYNCFVIPSPDDSYDGIFKNIHLMGSIMRTGGGVGVDLSTLRPEGSYVKGTNGFSSGPVAFANIYSETTLATSQGGSRRGALMLMLRDDHPDIEKFVTMKQKPGFCTGANISVKISDRFMEAVKTDSDWNLVWGGKVYKTIKARDLWDLIITSARKSAEPGLFFSERANKLSNLWYLKEYELIATNPCGEQPLNAWGVCNLGAINLSKFVTEDWSAIDWDRLADTIAVAVRFLDNVIDTTQYFYPQNERSQKEIRRIGLGTMGLADMLIKLKIRYGSPEAVELTDKLYEFIANKAYQASALLAAEKGPAPAYDSEKYLKGEFIKRLSDETRELIKKHGIRNTYILTQAPTGSTGLLSGVAGTGIEPVFAFTFLRKDRLGERIIRVPLLDELIERGVCTEDKATWPDYMVTANDLTPREHVDMQAVIQKWNDSAISKTTNMPAGTTDEQVAELYMYAYERGLKGITVYVDGSREGVLHHIDGKKEDSSDSNSKVVEFRKRPRKLSGTMYKQQTPIGKAYVGVFEDENGDVAEVHIDLGAAGSDIAAIAKGLGITATGMLNPRLQTLSNREKVEWLIKQYSKISGATFVGFGPNRVNSLPHAIAKVLEEHIAESEGAAEEHKGAATIDICPECGSASFVKQDGCQTCMTCAFSKCG
jgi:ribonucleoside-diphosphate reductase alpha chain